MTPSGPQLNKLDNRLLHKYIQYYERYSPGFVVPTFNFVRLTLKLHGLLEVNNLQGYIKGNTSTYVGMKSFSQQIPRQENIYLKCFG